MADRAEVIQGLEKLCKKGNTPFVCFDALELLKEQEVLLNKACETIADMGFDDFCDDLICDDGWCEENCKTSGTQPKCIERWLRKQVEQTNT